MLQPLETRVGVLDSWDPHLHQGFLLAPKNIHLYGLLGPTCLTDIYLFLCYSDSSDTCTEQRRRTEKMRMSTFPQYCLRQPEKLHHLLHGEVVVFGVIQMLVALGLTCSLFQNQRDRVFHVRTLIITNLGDEFF